MLGIRRQPGEGFVDALNRSVFYRDVLQRGGVPQALQATLDELGTDLRVSPRSLKELEDDLSYLPAWLQEKKRPMLLNIQMYATAGSERYVCISSAMRGRLFHFNCWSRWLGGYDKPTLSIGSGVCLASGATRSLTNLARVIDRWVSTNCTAAALASEFRYVRVEPRAATYEEGSEVESRWRELLSAATRPPLGREFEKWNELLIAAAKRPKLRQLFPRVGGHGVRFERCTRHPFKLDSHTDNIVIVRGNREANPRWTETSHAVYSVLGRDGQLLGVGSGDEAVDIVVRHLPEDCGPAVVGTVHDLARQNDGERP